jgi:hypothetical protein
VNWAERGVQSRRLFVLVSPLSSWLNLRSSVRIRTGIDVLIMMLKSHCLVFAKIVRKLREVLLWWMSGIAFGSLLCSTYPLLALESPT